jgi:hypothetical protein
MRREKTAVGLLSLEGIKAVGKVIQGLGEQPGTGGGILRRTDRVGNRHVVDSEG